MGIYCYCEKGHLVALVSKRVVRNRRVVEWIRGGSGLTIKQAPDYCFECGSPTMMKCTHCSEWIQIHASYCGKCGEAFPWTEHALAAAREYADEIDDLSIEDKAVLKGTFGDLTKDTARTPLAASRFMRIVHKAKPTVLETLRGILVDITSETASKLIMGGR